MSTVSENPGRYSDALGTIFSNDEERRSHTKDAPSSRRVRTSSSCGPPFLPILLASLCTHPETIISNKLYILWCKQGTECTSRIDDRCRWLIKPSHRWFAGRAFEAAPRQWNPSRRSGTKDPASPLAKLSATISCRGPLTRAHSSTTWPYSWTIYTKSFIKLCTANSSAKSKAKRNPNVISSTCCTTYRTRYFSTPVCSSDEFWTTFAYSLSWIVTRRR